MNVKGDLVGDFIFDSGPPGKEFCVDCGNMGCRVSKGGIQKSTYLKEIIPFYE